MRPRPWGSGILDQHCDDANHAEPVLAPPKAGAVGCDLHLHQQALDTTTPAGRAMFQMLGVFSEFERSIIRSRVKAGLARARIHGTKSGKPIGQQPLVRHKVEQIRAELVKAPASSRLRGWSGQVYLRCSGSKR